MAKRITSWQMLEEAILKPTARGIGYAVANATKKHLKEEIQASIYSSYSPKSYSRTRQFLNSVTIEKSTIYSGKIAQYRVVFDYKKIKPKAVPGTWNKHMSAFSEPFNKGNLVQVLEEGTVGTDSLFQREGAWFLENTKKWLNEKINGNGFSVADVTQVESYPGDYDIPPDKVPVGIRIRKRL